MKKIRSVLPPVKLVYVPSEIDACRLTPRQFRLYFHLVRLAGGGEAWPSIGFMAEHCSFSESTVQRCLRRFKELNLVHIRERPGSTNVYTLLSKSNWRAVAIRPKRQRTQGRSQ